jgi:hypothetical protein
VRNRLAPRTTCGEYALLTIVSATKSDFVRYFVFRRRYPHRHILVLLPAVMGCQCSRKDHNNLVEEALSPTEMNPSVAVVVVVDYTMEVTKWRFPSGGYHLEPIEWGPTGVNFKALFHPIKWRCQYRHQRVSFIEFFFLLMLYIMISD